MANWELTKELCPFLDRHLVIPLMEFLTVKGIYDETDLLRCKLELLSNTSMVDYTIEVHGHLYPDQVRWVKTNSWNFWNLFWKTFTWDLKSNFPALGLTVYNYFTAWLLTFFSNYHNIFFHKIIMKLSGVNFVRKLKNITSCVALITIRKKFLFLKRLSLLNWGSKSKYKWTLLDFFFL